MGLDTVIKLPGDVRVKDAANVIGILMGLAPVYDRAGYAQWVTVPGVHVASIPSLPECCHIQISSAVPLIDGEDAHTVMWHFEPTGGNARLMLPRSYPIWIAVGRRLVDFLGGSIHYADCAGGEPDYAKTSPRNCNCPNDGDEWDDFQQEMFNIKPITKKELKQAEQWASYPR